MNSTTSQQLTVLAETTSDGVVDRTFTLGEVTGVLWSPASAAEPSPLLLMGHGGGLHKRAAGLVARARAAVVRDGFHVVAIDAPGHGDRPRSAQDQTWVDAIHAARAAGEPLDPVLEPFYASLAERAVPEWRATLDALAGLPEIDLRPGVGYSGMTLASAIGLPLVAAETRVRAAVLGGVPRNESLLAAARRITVPVEVLLPWDDPELDRDAGLALFEALGSADKTLHAFPGSHTRVPLERVDTRFFARQLRGQPNGS